MRTSSWWGRAKRLRIACLITESNSTRETAWLSRRWVRDRSFWIGGGYKCRSGRRRGRTWRDDAAASHWAGAAAAPIMCAAKSGIRDGPRANGPDGAGDCWIGPSGRLLLAERNDLWNRPGIILDCDRVPILNERNLLPSIAGRDSFAVPLFQDLAAILVLALILRSRYSGPLLPSSLFVELGGVPPTRKAFCDEVDKTAHCRRLAASGGKDRMDDTGQRLPLGHQRHQAAAPEFLLHHIKR